MAAISISNLTVGYAEKPVISDLSLTIADGSLFTLLGPSGCGKTTLLRSLAGFVPLRSGRVHFGERDVSQLPAHLRDVGMVFQDYALFPDKTVFDNVAYGLRARQQNAATIQATVSEYLERVGLSAYAQRLPAALSGGQRQRVALARALAIKPTVLLMDEPLSNLDAKLRVQVRETIADLQKEIGVTTVLVTHDQEEALALSDRIGLMRDGRIEQAGTPEELYAQPRTAYVADFVGAANTVAVALPQAVQAGSLANVSMAGHTIRARADAPLPAGPAVWIARPENLTLLSSGSAPAPGACTVSCTVLRRQFLGARTLFTVQLAPGVAVRVETHQHTPAWAVGAPALLQWDAQACTVVAAS
jgi:iron(III) transport system ATP-binding protein